jgi:hypothetical protein
MTDRRQQRALRRHLTEMNAEAGVEGARAWCVYVVQPEAIAGLTETVSSNRPEARRAEAVLAATAEALLQLVTGKQDFLCLFCDQVRFGLEIAPGAWVLVFALRDDPERALAHGICEQCCGDASHEVLEARVLALFQKDDPTMRRITVVGGVGGHA